MTKHTIAEVMESLGNKDLVTDYVYESYEEQFPSPHFPEIVDVHDAFLNYTGGLCILLELQSVGSYYMDITKDVVTLIPAEIANLVADREHLEKIVRTDEDKEFYLFTLECFDKKTELVVAVYNFSIPKAHYEEFRNLFNMPIEETYNGYPVQTVEQQNFLLQHTKRSLDTNLYDYFVVKDSY